MSTAPAAPPWLQFPALSEWRLKTVAAMIRDVRHEAVLTHEPSRGDDEWVLGVRAYKRTCFEIARAAVGEHRDWLSVIESEARERAREEVAPAVLNPELHFVFAIGGVPLRFYRGLADEQTSKSLKRFYPEIRAYQHVLEFVPAPVMDRVLRLAVETDVVGEVERVVLVQLDDKGMPHNPWLVPLEAPAKISQFPAVEKGRELSAPSITPRNSREGEKKPG